MKSLSEIGLSIEQDITKIEADLRSVLPGIDPAIAKDVNGRYILLDAYVALAQIKLELRK